MRILHIHDDRDSERCFILAELQRGKGSNVELFNIVGKRFLNLKLLVKSSNADIIHIHNLAGLGKWIKRIKSKPMILHYSEDEINKNPLYKRQKDEQYFEKILVTSPELLESGFHSEPVFVKLDSNENLMRQLYPIYYEAIAV